MGKIQAQPLVSNTNAQLLHWSSTHLYTNVVCRWILLLLSRSLFFIIPFAAITRFLTALCYTIAKSSLNKRAVCIYHIQYILYTRKAKHRTVKSIVSIKYRESLAHARQSKIEGIWQKRLRKFKCNPALHAQHHASWHEPRRHLK